MINEYLSKKKSPHFREKYLVMSYLNNNQPESTGQSSLNFRKSTFCPLPHQKKKKKDKNRKEKKHDPSFNQKGEFMKMSLQGIVV